MSENELNFSNHVLQRIEERKLEKQWITDAVASADKTIIKSDKEVVYFKKIADCENRTLKVVVNPISRLIVTAHFDRKETKNI